MFDSDPWRRLRRTSMIAAVSYVLIVIISSLLLTWALPQSSKPVTAAPPEHSLTLPPPATGRISGGVHDIFGDAVKHARVSFGSQHVTTDELGGYTIDALPVGSYEVTIQAEGFQKRTFTYVVSEGLNSPRIKYDTGLWPVHFAVDFHTFYAPPAKELVYGIVGLANPSSAPVYIVTLRIEDNRGRTIQDFLATGAAYQTFVLSYASTQLSLDPRPAVLLPSRGYIGHIEMRPSTLIPGENHTYRLVVEHADPEGHRTGVYARAAKEAPLEPQEDYNPHSP